MRGRIRASPLGARPSNRKGAAARRRGFRWKSTLPARRSRFRAAINVASLAGGVALYRSSTGRNRWTKLAVYRFRVQMSSVTVRILPLVTALVLTSSACGWTGTPSAQECVDDWNARAGRPARERVVAGQFGSAMARGWLAKETYPGCGIIFITELDGNEPWLTCTRAFRSCRRPAHRVELRSRRSARPHQSFAGPDFRANAAVFSGSELVWSDPR